MKHCYIGWVACPMCVYIPMAQGLSEPAVLRHRVSPNSILVATALADAHGLAVEGLSPRRLKRWYPKSLPVFSVWPGRGLVSDDTEHAALTAQALAMSAGHPQAFEKELARRLKRWLWAFPPATGLATGRALLRLSLGVSPEKSGARSAGNGACMRAPILGAMVTSSGGLYDLVRRSSRMTHRDDRAIFGAFLIARWVQLTVAAGRPPRVEELRQATLPMAREKEAWMAVFDRLEASLTLGQSTDTFVAEQGWKAGPTGFVMHTVPAALHVLYSVPGTWEDVVRAAVRLGGDADSVGALVGAMASVDPARGPLPSTWVESLADRPLTVPWLQHVENAAQQAMLEGRSVQPPEIPYGAMVLRNLGFLGLVLAHGLRRLLPPY